MIVFVPFVYLQEECNYIIMVLVIYEIWPETIENFNSSYKEYRKTIFMSTAHVTTIKKKKQYIADKFRSLPGKLVVDDLNEQVH